MQVLQMNAAELAEYLQQQALENPVIDLNENQFPGVEEIRRSWPPCWASRSRPFWIVWSGSGRWSPPASPSPGAPWQNTGRSWG